MKNLGVHDGAGVANIKCPPCTYLPSQHQTRAVVAGALKGAKQGDHGEAGEGLGLEARSRSYGSAGKVTCL
jgi:hypothetical protein